MDKFEIIEKMKQLGFSESDIVEMFICWLSTEEIERCVKDYLNDRDIDFSEIK